MSSKPTAGAVIFAKNPAKVASFYEAVLAASVERAESDLVVLAVGPFQLVIHTIPEPIAQGIELSDPPALREETPIKLFFPVSSLAQARATASAFGGGLAPQTTEWSGPGFRACDGWDPEGNVVQLRQDQD